MKLFILLSLIVLNCSYSKDSNEELIYHKYQREVESSYNELSSVITSLSKSISEETKKSDIISQKVKSLSQKASLIEEYISKIIKRIVLYFVQTIADVEWVFVMLILWNKFYLNEM